MDDVHSKTPTTMLLRFNFLAFQVNRLSPPENLTLASSLARLVHLYNDDIQKPRLDQPFHPREKTDELVSSLEKGQRRQSGKGEEEEAFCVGSRNVVLVQAPPFSPITHNVTALDLAASGTHPKQVHELKSFTDCVEPLMEFMERLGPEERVILVASAYPWP
ncbi:hypothetical protein K1719_029621 [Acacia pycnantha]|nr:hypothetical protein K1719_029621 [Acacia pycnantha]